MEIKKLFKISILRCAEDDNSYCYRTSHTVDETPTMHAVSYTVIL